MSEAEQQRVPFLHPLNERRDVLGVIDFLEHAEDGLVRAAVQRPVESRGCRGRR